MSHYRNFPVTCMIKQKGQALVELASFGAILLLCLGVLIQYGMEANQQQNIQMQAFRKTMRAAYYKTGPAATMSLSMTSDKPIPNPSDPWGFPDRRPVGAGASVTWDTYLQANYTTDYSQVPEDSDLPRTIIEINSDRGTLGLTQANLSDAGINNIGLANGAFTTARYREGPCNGNIRVFLENPQRLITNEEYMRLTVNCNRIIVKDQTAKDMDGNVITSAARIQQAYFKGPNGLVYTLNAADVDNDNEVESIIAVQGNQPCNATTGYCGTLSRFRWMDFQEARNGINSELTAVLPWETNKNQANLNVQQGLLVDYRTRKNFNNTLNKTEDSTSLTTTTTLQAGQTTTHTIRYQDANGNRTTQEYNTNFTPAVLESYNLSVRK